MSSSERPSDPPADLNEATSTATADPSVAAEPAKKKRKDLTFAHVKPLKLPTGEELAQQEVMDNCAVRSAFAGVAGVGLGAMFGIFMGTLEPAHIPMDSEIQQNWKQVLKETAKNTRAKSWSYMKGFGGMGLLFSGAECVVEKVRARHDMWNSALAGCFAGGLLAYNTGPKGICFGCASFAAFSVAIDAITDR